MVLATLYIMWCSAKNRFHRRLRRLREPRYLIGALVGGAYLFFASDRPGGKGGLDIWWIATEQLKKK